MLSAALFEFVPLENGLALLESFCFKLLSHVLLCKLLKMMKSPFWLSVFAAF